MAVKGRYVEVDELPETGMLLASKPYLNEYLAVLDKAEAGNVAENGAYCNDTDKDAREVSYVYALNTVYRSLDQWQENHADHEDRDVAQIKQDIVEHFSYFMEKEFPGTEYEVYSGMISYNTKDKISGQVIDPQFFEIEAEHKAFLDDILGRIDEFAKKNDPFVWSDEVSSFNPEQNEAYTHNRATRYRDLEQQEKSQYNLFSQIYKMCYLLSQKSENKQVYNFVSIEQRAKTHLNELKTMVENITKQDKVDNGYLFSKNRQKLADKFNALGMDLVWYKEMPYEADFVNYLPEMKKTLTLGNATAEFYNDRLPLLYKLSEELVQTAPDKTEKLAKLQQDYKMNDSSPEKLVAYIDETYRVAGVLQEIDQAKANAMRAAWDGIIYRPDEDKLSPVLQEIIATRNLCGNQNLNAEQQQKVEAYIAQDYSVLQYKANNNPIWHTIRQVPQFNGLEKKLFKQAAAFGVSPQNFAKLSYNDIAYLLNRAKAENSGQMFAKDGIKIVSDKTKYVKNLVNKHEKELRRAFEDFYSRKYMMEIVQNGAARQKSQTRLQKKATFAAQQKTNEIIEKMRTGIVDADFNIHHFPPLSKIAQFERISGKPFYKINESVLLVHREMHQFFHVNENSIDKNGKMRIGHGVSNQTKYINRKRLVKDGDEVIGYYGSAISCMVMPKHGIIMMPDCNSYVFDGVELHQSRAIQKRLIELNHNFKVRGKRLTIPYFNFEKTMLFLRKAQELITNKAKEVVMKTALVNTDNAAKDNKQEMVKARGLNKMNQERYDKNDDFAEMKKVKTPLPQVKSNPNSQKIATLRQKKMLYA